MAGDIQLSKKAQERFNNRIGRAYERIEKRVDEKDRTQAKEDIKEKLERRAQWWQGVRDNLKEQGQEFLNYWTYDPDAEQKEEEKSSTNTGASSTNTTTGDLSGGVTTTSGGVTTSNGVTTGGGATTGGTSIGGATTSDGVTSHQQAAQEAMRKNAKSYADYAKRVAGGASAYGELLREAIQQKNNIAFRKERTARAQAIANALGTLVNTITAGAIAKKNGTIPIIAGHDATADTNLRKSIEDRYAMENESENLLMQLVNSRIAHEKELAKAQLDADLKTNELGYKAASEDLRAAAKKEEAQATREFRKEIAQDNADLKRELAKTKSTRVYINNGGSKNKGYDKTDFMNSVNTKMTQRGSKMQAYEPTTAEKGGLGRIHQKLKDAGLTTAQWDAAITYLNTKWGENSSLFGSDPATLANEAIKDAKRTK